MELRGNGWVKTQMGCGYGAKIVRSLRQDYPFISGGVAHHVIELIYASGVLPAVAEEKATAGVLWTDRPVAGKEGQRRVRKWQLFSRRDANEIGSCCFIVLVVKQGAKVEETGVCLRELFLRCSGWEMRARQWRETHLNRQIDLTGSRDRISTMRSSVRSAAALALFLEPDGSIRGRASQSTLTRISRHQPADPIFLHE